MSDLDSLLAAIRAEPQEDTPRLVLADYLREHGQEDRGEFIAVQVESAKCGACHPVGGVTLALACGHPEREQELLSRDYPPIQGVRSRNIDGRWQNNPYGWIGEGGFAMDWCWFRRGFLSKVRCDWHSWSRHGDSILADPWAPGLDEVELTTPVYFDLDGDESAPLRIAGQVIDISPPAAVRELPLEEYTKHYLSARWPAVRSWKLPPEPEPAPGALRQMLFRNVGTQEQPVWEPTGTVDHQIYEGRDFTPLFPSEES